MRSTGSTTQMEISPENATRMRITSNSNIVSTPRTSSPRHEETNTYFNPPNYETYVQPNEDKENPSEEEMSHFTGQYFSTMPEVPSSSNQHYSQTPQPTPQNVNQLPQSTPENVNQLLEKPACDLLSNRQAVWVVKGKGLRLSSLSAAVLIKDGLLKSKHLTLLYSPYVSPIIDPGPTDPISGILTATHRTVVGVLGGVADYPIAASRIATRDVATSKREAASFALDPGKGLSRIVGTGLKAPMELSVGISQGFHNAPRLWGDRTVRAVEPVNGVGSGLKAAGKGFGLGLYDGLTGIVTQPVKGAKEGGVVGCVGGVFKGIGGVACKPAAGVMALPAYTFQGFYQQFRKARGMNNHAYIVATTMQQGREELDSCTLDERNKVLSGWHLMQFQEAQSGHNVQHQYR